MLVLTFALLGGACTTEPEASYRRVSGETVPIAPCEDGDTMCLDVLDANVALAGTTVESLEVVALLRGPFDDGSEYVYGGANLVKPQYIDEANMSYGALTRYPLSLQFVPGEDTWVPGRLVHFSDGGTDGASLAPLCGQTLFAELTLGAPARVNGGHAMSSTTWLKGVALTCR